MAKANQQSIGTLGKVSKRPKCKIPEEDEQKRIRHSLGMNPHERFNRCRGKSRTAVRAFEAKGDTSHSERGHLCDLCRCKRIAGAHTEHYGIGYCFDHENVTGSSRRNSKLMMEAQLAAIRMGYPDKVYKYETTNQYVDRIREQAEQSGGMTDLREELNVLRGHMQELMSAFSAGKDGLTEGHDKDGVPLRMTDKTYIQLVAKLAMTVGTMSKTNLVITENDYVHVDQVNIWFAQVVRILQRTLEAEHPIEYEEIIKQVKEIPQMTKGRIK